MVFVLKVLLIQFVSGLVALAIASSFGNKIVIRRMVETRTQLQELLEQLQESEPNK